MIALDTNILARFFIDDPDDPEAAKQQKIAKQLMLNSDALFVSKTVVLELEWVMRGMYGMPPSAIAKVVEHLFGMSHIVVEDWEVVKDALDAHTKGLDFADALHLNSSRRCETFTTFDNRKFARRANRLGLLPKVEVAT